MIVADGETRIPEPAASFVKSLPKLVGRHPPGQRWGSSFFLFPSAFFTGRTVAEIGLICLLLMGVAALDIVARRVGLPHPVLLVLSGLVLSLVPYLPHVAFDPELALLVFLPPLLYRAAYFTSWRDFRRNLRPIALLAFGLVPDNNGVGGLGCAFVDARVPLGLGADSRRDRFTARRHRCDRGAATHEDPPPHRRRAGG